MAIIKSNRNFGVELECYMPEYIFNNVGFKTKLIVAGLGTVRMEGDGSLSSDKHGVEFVTPILNGEGGDTFLKTLCELLVKYEFSVDIKAGFHVHVGTEDYMLKRKLARNLFALYYILDPLLFSFVSESRRNVNRFCYPLAKNYSLSQIFYTSKKSDIEALWYKGCTKYEIEKIKTQKYHSTRYHGVNFHSMLSKSNIELRHHQGTIVYDKVAEWVNLHTRIVDKAVDIHINTILDKGMYTLPELKSWLYEWLELDDTSRQHWDACIEKFGWYTNIYPKTTPVVSRPLVEPTVTFSPYILGGQDILREQEQSNTVQRLYQLSQELN